MDADCAQRCYPQPQRRSASGRSGSNGRSIGQFLRGERIGLRLSRQPTGAALGMLLTVATLLLLSAYGVFLSRYSKR